ncbi:hypothetical protein NFC81_04400 [Salinispirillum sp. LH 10-3-1]|uniref:Uncharacterized protein n=1 Tax=Salinispirillum sp. LH 10-3-1 TaxID=2952525 RepID=A0AB38YI90_9GAMM
MTQPTAYRIVWFWLTICSLHALFLVLAVFTTAFVDTPLEAFVMTVLAVPYLLHQTGLPVLQNEGLSGWGMPMPNTLGWLLSVLAWLALYWLVASGVERLTRHSS